MEWQGASTSAKSDAYLVQKAQSGDARAWSELVDRYSSYVYSLIRSTQLAESDQPDCFQFVFIELFQALHRLVQPESIRSWIRITTLRHAIRTRDKLRGTVSLEGHDKIEDITISFNTIDSDQGFLIHEAVATLKPKCRELIQMLFFSEPPIPYSEVARKLGIKVGSIGNTRIRCFEDLQKALISRGFE